ncbi:MAG: DUF1464 family protein [Candidatus Bathyarchaeia archaeon]
MAKALGIDPGTKSMDLFGFDDSTDEIFLDEAVPRDEVTTRPRVVLDIVREAVRRYGSIDAIVGPSGYGLPLKMAREASESDIMLATFVSQSDARRRLKIIGLRELMLLMRRAEDLNVWFTPGIIHLPTVPDHRKINRIDMGTADKLFSVVLAVKDQAERRNIDYEETSFILVEVGFAYTAAVAVDKGRVIDGVGGTVGGAGYLGMGGMDAELAYALANAASNFSKLLLFSGGVAHVGHIDPYAISPEEFVKLAKRNEKVSAAYEAMLEAILKDVAVLLATLRNPGEIILSGRFVRVPDFLADLKDRLKGFLGKLVGEVSVEILGRRAKNVKEGAEGAAVLANGIAGGRYSRLVDVMRLRESRGTIFDHIYLEKTLVQRLKEIYSQTPQP